jgi:cytochrome c6
MPLVPIARLQRAMFLLLLGLGLSMGTAQAETVEVDEEALELGREVFQEIAQPPCGICHTLADAETSGTIAPNLDGLRPGVEQVREALRDGPGAMPTYSETLSEEEIDAVAQYVAAVAGQE